MFTELAEPTTWDDSAFSAPIDSKLQALFGRPRRVAWLYEKPDTSTFRYRTLNMVEALERDPAKRVGAAWFSAAELPAVEAIIPKLDMLVLTRYRYGASLQRLVMQAHHHGVKVLFDCDDLVFDPAFAHLVAHTLGQEVESAAVWDYWFAYMGRLHAAASLCDGGITTNSDLAARMSHVMPGKAVGVIRNFMNRQQQTYSRSLLEAKRASGWRRTGPVTIGYFSGSATHNLDFAIAAPALVRLLQSDPDVSVRLVGLLDAAGPLACFGKRVGVLPYMDYVNLQRSIAEVEINIAPLQENAFTHCKSELKFFEAAAVGTWTLATPTSAFRASIDDGKTGRLIRAHEWDSALAEAVALARDTAAYAQRAEAAAQVAYRTYGWDQQATSIVTTLFPDLESTSNGR